jgi:hypothetical protein
MFHRAVKCAFMVLLPASCLLADFSYQQSSKITGGMMAGMMKFAGAFSKTAREPMESTVMVKGDRMVHLSANHATIMDVAKETITEIDFQKKTYSVMTFAEMKAMLQQLAEKRKDKDAPEMNVNVSVDDTGQTKTINGMSTKEMVLKIVMETQDAKSGQKGGITMTTDMWMAPKIAGYSEITDLHRRMAEKLGWTPGQNMFMQQPEVMKGMAEAAKQMGKFDGMPVYQVVKMGAQGQPQPAGEGAAAPPAAQEQQQQQQPAAEKPSIGGALGGALGGRRCPAPRCTYGR